MTKIYEKFLHFLCTTKENFRILRIPEEIDRVVEIFRRLLDIGIYVQYSSIVVYILPFAEDFCWKLYQKVKILLDTPTRGANDEWK